MCLRWAKSRDSYRRIASESYRCNSENVMTERPSLGQGTPGQNVVRTGLIMTIWSFWPCLSCLEHRIHDFLVFWWAETCFEHRMNDLRFFGGDAQVFNFWGTRPKTNAAKLQIDSGQGYSKTIDCQESLIGILPLIGGGLRVVTYMSMKCPSKIELKHKVPGNVAK